MLSTWYKHDDCFKVLGSTGADLGLVNSSAAPAALVVATNRWIIGFQHAVLDVIRSEKVPQSSDLSAFSPLMFAARFGDAKAFEVVLLMQPEVDIDEQDENGFSPAMVAAKEGHVDAFRCVVFACANVKLSNKAGETAVMLSQSNNNSDLFEQVMLKFALEKGNAGGLYALHVEGYAE